MTTDEMIELWRSGLTGRQIAERAGVSRGLVLGRLNRAGELRKIDAAEKRRRQAEGSERRRRGKGCRKRTPGG